MGIIHLPDELREVIDRQIAEGRAESEADFVIAAVQRYAEALEHDQDEIAAAADEGIADIEAGRFEVISGPEDMERLQGELTATLDKIAGQHRLAPS
jgi:Arc/MetJ-type ribon-helix-helix transcriptional regulator